MNGEISYGAVARVMKELGVKYDEARRVVEARRSGARGARELLKKDGYWKPGGAGGKQVGAKRKKRVAAKTPVVLEPRRKKPRKSGSLAHGTNPAKKGKRPQSGKKTPIE